MNITEQRGEGWKLRTGNSNHVIDEITSHVQLQASRTLHSDPVFDRKPREQREEARAIIPAAVEATFDAVANQLLRGDREALNSKLEERIQRRVAKRLVRNPWWLPFGGRVMRLAIRTAVTLALGYLRIQFPVIATCDLYKVAGILQAVVDRKRVSE